MDKPRSKDIDAYFRLGEIARTAKRAARKAQEESRRLSVPNVYSINGIIYYERESGELSTVDPYLESRPIAGA